MELYGDQRQVEWGQPQGLEEPMLRLIPREGEVYPERPGLPDCAYYLRTGSCGYGSKCRYNHPRDRHSSFGGVQFPERVGEPACQFYLRTGTCKFGASCKFDHPKNAGGSLSYAPLNIYGYPLRPDEEDCSYYLKTGQCKFGLTCKYNHPQQLPATSSSMPAAASARPYYPTVQSLSSPLSPEQLNDASSSYKVARPPLLPLPSAYGPPMLLHPGVLPVQNWTPYSGSISPAPSPGAQQTSIGASSMYGVMQMGSTPNFAGTFPQLPSYVGHAENIVKERRFPERPGQPDCSYYMKTGDCKYGLSCRYNHPPDRMILSECALSPLGLPLRPGIQPCPFYMRNGMCKFGRTCKFDHPFMSSPANYSPPSSYTELPG